MGGAHPGDWSKALDLTLQCRLIAIAADIWVNNYSLFLGSAQGEKSSTALNLTWQCRW